MDLLVGLMKQLAPLFFTLKHFFFGRLLVEIVASAMQLSRDCVKNLMEWYFSLVLVIIIIIIFIYYIFNNNIISRVCMIRSRWQIANQARSAGLAITISYPTSVSRIIVLLKTRKEIPQNQLQSLQKRCARLRYLWSMYMSSYTIAR